MLFHILLRTFALPLLFAAYRFLDSHEVISYGLRAPDGHITKQTLLSCPPQVPNPTLCGVWGRTKSGGAGE
ncbi:hypothetical protein BDW74DRAFT_145069 [Aspergillus multicolor]|uniref:uncharacterized protein n=1 Tax=Aspergillus multicolor TaxID=41759 RepID=UPI003CCCE76A